jgi:hypothetical protein
MIRIYIKFCVHARMRTYRRVCASFYFVIDIVLKHLRYGRTINYYVHHVCYIITYEVLMFFTRDQDNPNRSAVK